MYLNSQIDYSLTYISTSKSSSLSSSPQDKEGEEESGKS